MGHFLDHDRWARREHFDLYRGFANPFFNVCVQVDATRAWRASREPQGPSFFLASVFLALRAANEVEAFRTRVRGDRAFVHDRVSITPTVMRLDRTFAFARLEPSATFAEFMERSAPLVTAACEIKPIVVSHPDDDVIYQTTLPWLRFTAFSNALNGNGDSVPRVAFGKCSPDGDRWKLPVSVEVHHAVVDGVDVARFIERLESGFDELLPR
ncbi:MAG TPA: CatA-like O-acetyltransferase [Gemmatimonadaceae bacterium]|nr:CatA-like O-acetyltransferase [Gemmatimonadaceae bacterium]